MKPEDVVAAWEKLDEDIRKEFEQQQKSMGKAVDDINVMSARLQEIEQKMVRKGSGDTHRPTQTLGEHVINSDAFKSWNGRGKIAIEIERKSITSDLGSAGATITPDFRPDIVPIARRRLTIRDLIPQATTNSNAVEYPRQLSRTNNAAMVAEGATKPESDYTFELKTANVRTLAHWITVTKQAAEDSAVLRSYIDTELRFGLALVEEDQFLSGDGTGQNLHGIIPQADTFDWGTFPVPASATQFDFLLAAIAAVRANLFEPTAVVMNDVDLHVLQSVKDSTGRYIANAGPFSGPLNTVWGLAAVGTPEMTAGEFLVGDFQRGAQIYDRQQATVEVSADHDDYFVKNLLAVRAEERLTLTVKQPRAFVHGSFSYVSG
jgi:HK97 family phage major capsid protein